MEPNWQEKKTGPFRRQIVHQATDPETNETSGWKRSRRECLSALAKKRRVHEKAETEGS